MPRLFENRREAGKVLAAELAARGYGPDGESKNGLIVLALPRGGVPVGAEVAAVLKVPLDVFVVRKLGVPYLPELAFGAIASGGVRVFNEDVVRRLGIPESVIDDVSAAETSELRRRDAAYRGGLTPLEPRAARVILVDDGLATGASMRAAVQAVREKGAARVVVAVPTASRAACEAMGRLADEVVAVVTPQGFMAVGKSYRDFTQTSDEEVATLLAEARRRTSRRLAS